MRGSLAALALLAGVALAPPVRSAPILYEVSIDLTTDNRSNPAPASPDLVMRLQIDSSWLGEDGDVAFEHVDGVSIAIAPGGFGPEGFAYVSSWANWNHRAALVVAWGDVVALRGMAMSCLDGRAGFPDDLPLCETSTVPGLSFDPDGGVLNATSGSHFPQGHYSVQRVVPEPGTGLLLCAGLSATAFARRRRARA